MRNLYSYYVNEYLRFNRRLRKCSNIYNFISLSSDIGFCLGQLYARVDECQARARIARKFNELENRVGDVAKDYCMEFRTKK